MGWAQIAMFVASAVLQNEANKSAEKKQRNIADQDELYRSQKASEGRRAINQFLERQQPKALADERGAVDDELGAGLRNSVDTVKGFEVPDVITGGKVSSDYNRVRAAGKQRTAKDIDRAIAQMKAIGAPGELGLREARRFSQTAGEVGAANSAVANVSPYFQRAIGSVRPDPYLALASGLLSGAGKAGVGGGYSVGTSGASSAAGLRALGG